MLTIKAEVEKGKVRNDGTYNVRIRFTKDRVVKRISTSLFATDVHFLSNCGFLKYQCIFNKMLTAC